MVPFCAGSPAAGSVPVLVLSTGPSSFSASQTAFVESPAAGPRSPAFPSLCLPARIGSLWPPNSSNSLPPPQIELLRRLCFQFPCVSPSHPLVIAIQGIRAGRAKVEIMCSGRRAVSCQSSAGCGAVPSGCSRPSPGPSALPGQSTGSNAASVLKCS